jgi:glycine/D-amino acid oxidase-like deaminating enzyme/nitrite reductase/ring-hydroxylating ferredoxin subunit
MDINEIGNVGQGNDLPGKPVSLWIATTPDTNYPALPQHLSVDVAVLGGGIAGIATAYLLKQRGATVALVEAGRIIKSVTGNTTAKVTSLHGLIYAQLINDFGPEKARLYGEAQESAIEQIAALIEQLRIDCDFRRTSAYTFTTNEQEIEQITKEVDAATRLGLPASYTEYTPLPFPIKAAVKFENQAQFHPRKYLLALATMIPGDGSYVFEQIPGDGSYVFEQTRAMDIDEGNPCTVRTSRGELRARAVVLATHFPFQDPNIYFASMYPTRSYALACRLGGPVPEGMYLSTTHHSIRNTPYDDEPLMILGGEGHKTGQGGDTREHYRRLEQWARASLDVQAVEFRWSTQDYNTVDKVPYIGKLSSGSKHLYVATGFGGWGMTNSHVAAMLLTDIITGRDNPWRDLFDPSRLKLITSARNFVKENLNVAKEFMADRLRVPELHDLNELPRGHGKVVKWQGQSVAIYKDDQDGIHACDPVCTHMGCIVHWNSAERSWDCPCHGSRFSYDGTVIQGPANKNLVPVRLEAKEG